MTSFLFEIDERSENVGRFINRVRKELVRAVVDAKRTWKISQNDIAAKLETSPSVLSRQLSGEGNLTLKTVADVAWALGKEPFFELRDPERTREINYYTGTSTTPVLVAKNLSTQSITSAGELIASSKGERHVLFENVM